MIPFSRFLLAVLLLPVSMTERVRTLSKYKCFGVGSESMQSLMDDLSSDESLPEGISQMWQSDYETISETPPQLLAVAKSFAMELEILDYYNFLLGDEPTSIVEKVMNTASSSSTYRIVSVLSMLEEGREVIVESIKARKNIDLDYDQIDSYIHMFLDFSDMSEDEISTWVSSHTNSRDRYIYRLAIYEPKFMVFDELGIPSSLTLAETSDMIMSRSARKFNVLSRSNHVGAMKEARSWGKLALESSKDNEKSKTGNIHDFLAKFQISLLEIDDESIERHSEDEIS